MYERRVRATVATVLALNFLLAFAKITFGLRADSLSVLGDGLHSFIDAASNVVALIFLGAASRPADEDHPFGHGRYETVGALALALLLFVTAIELAREAVTHLVFGAPTPRIDLLTIAVMVVTLAVNLAVTAFERRRARELRSDLLAADAGHTASDAYVTLGVLASFAFVRLGFAWADPLVALVVAFTIVWAGVQVVRRAEAVVTDRVALETAAIDRVVRAVPGVASVHDIRSRGRGRDVFVQMHLVVETNDVGEAHHITEEVERRLAREFGAREVFVHVEPEDDRSGPPGTRV